MADIYKSDGVDVEAGDNFSSYCAKICRSTFGNNRFVVAKEYSEHFRGRRTYRFCGLPEDTEFDAGCDGIGTKVIVIDAADVFQTAAFDMVAMCAGDITRNGGLPLMFLNILDVSSIGEEGSLTSLAARRLMAGLKEAAQAENLVVWRGETAELGPCVGSSNINATLQFNWGGTIIGAFSPIREITGDTLGPQQAIMALRESGFRSNGISSVRKAFAFQYGDNWPVNPEAKEDLRAAAVPSILYDRFLTYLNGWDDPDFMPVIKVHAIAHITGGGIRSKFGEDILFPRGLSANLHDLYEPPEIMKKVVSWRGMMDEEIYSVFNGGQGAIVVINKEDVDLFLSSASDYGIDAKLCGHTFYDTNTRLEITSKFSGSEIRYVK